MKKIIIGQIFLLVLTILMGLILKTDLESSVRIFHKVFAGLALVTGITVLANAFIQNESREVKILATITFLFIISAGIGGRLTQTGVNYDVAFMQMTVSAVAALIVSIVTYTRVKSKPNT